MSTKTPFKAIIIGGGPVGLTFAQCFSAAGLDFTLLERRETVTPEEGAGIAISPTTFRIYDQLGLLDAINKIATPIPQKHVMTKDGHRYNSYEFHLRECHGRPMAFVHRHELLTMLHSTLSDDAKSKIQTNKSIASIVSTDHGVEVTCDDGSVISGSIVIGADGVHSKTRRLMNDLSGHEEPVFETTFQGMFGNFPRAAVQSSVVSAENEKNVEEGSQMEPGHDWEVHSDKISSQCFVGRERGWFIIYRPLAPGPTRERKTYTEEDVQAFAKDLIEMDLHLTDKVKFADVFKVVNKAGMTQLQEGAVLKRSFQRIVLAGDACNKITPNVGLGYNNGVVDVVYLTNALKKLVEDAGQTEIRTETIEELFARYQEDRRALSETVDSAARRVIRTVTHSDFVKYVLDRWVNPVLGLDKVYGTKVMGPLLAKQQVLEWLGEKNYLPGKIPWVHRGLVAGEVKA